MFVFDKDRKIKILMFSLTAPLLRITMLGLGILLTSVLFSAIFQYVDAHAAMM